MHKQRILFLRYCDSIVIHWMKSNFWPKNCSNFLRSSNPDFVEIWGKCLEFGICKVWQVLCVHVALNGGTLQIIAFAIQYFSAVNWSSVLTVLILSLCLYSCATEHGMSIRHVASINSALSTFWGRPGSAVKFPVLPSYSLFHLMHPIFVYDQGDTSNIFG